jgi:hypothetical protein
MGRRVTVLNFAQDLLSCVLELNNLLMLAEAAGHIRQRAVAKGSQSVLFILQ